MDSGKTSLAKALSEQVVLRPHASLILTCFQASTAAFDKNPQSQERGITIDLGFSVFNIRVRRFHCCSGTQ